VCCSEQLLLTKPETIDSGYLMVVLKSKMIEQSTKDAFDRSTRVSPPLPVRKKGENLRYRDLLQAAPDAIIVVNQAGMIVLVNAQAERLFGYKRDELLGRPAESLVSEHFRVQHNNQHSRFLGALQERPTVAAQELFGIRKDGTEFPAEIRLSPLDTKKGVLVSSAIRDISDRRRTEEDLRRLASIVACSDDAITGKTLEGIITSWNAGAERIYGYSAKEAIGRPASMLIPIDRPDEMPEMLECLKRGETIDHFETVRRRKDGKEIQIELTVSPIRDALERIVGASTIGRDISIRKEAERHLVEMEARYRGILEAAPDAIVVVNEAGEIVLLNRQAEKQFGYHRDELLGQRVKNIIPTGFAERLTADGLQSLEGSLAYQIGTGIELVGRRKDGSEFPIEIMLSPQECAEGILVTAAIRDVSAARAMTLQMVHTAQHDFLTGLPNRALLNDRVEQAIVFASRHATKVGVLFLDLDGFKHINDSLGHPIGDKLLQSVAARVVNCIRGSDTVSRQGGDEFIVLLSEMQHSEDAAITSRRMLQAVANPHSIDHHDLYVTASIGVSVYPDDGLDAETLIKNADTAMYQAKEKGRQGYQFFKRAMNVRAVERQSIEESLRCALERQEFSLHYQPKVDLREGIITGAEALIRWTHPHRGQVTPAQFIPVAEDCGLIVPIGNWVLREACRQARTWIDAGLLLPRIAVNISSIEFRNEHFLEGIFAILEETGLDARFLELELTESALMKHAEFATHALQTLRAEGAQVAVDDFGTGYSSLSYLAKFPIDSLKIDQSFVRQITTAPEEKTIVTAIISMGRSLNLRVVAEGVETLEELTFLHAHQCDEAQGYYFSRPLPPQQFAELLKTDILGTGFRRARV
jgi:diguanylate cyclase (GGDEF)-like protein/PAS domain S-box-containing protein